MYIYTYACINVCICMYYLPKTWHVEGLYIQLETDREMEEEAWKRGIIRLFSWFSKRISLDEFRRKTLMYNCTLSQISLIKPNNPYSTSVINGALYKGIQTSIYYKTVIEYSPISCTLMALYSSDGVHIKEFFYFTHIKLISFYL